MKNATSHFLAVLCLLSVTAAAQAMSNTELTVAGTISPDACTPTLSAEGQVDHGRILAGSLDPHDLKPLPTQTLDLSVGCNGRVLFVLVGVDNRADSSLGPEFYYGLGTNVHAPDERLGMVSVTLDNAVGDGQPVRVLASSNQGQTWFPETTAHPRNYMGFAPPGTLVPGPYRQLTATLYINTFINAATHLTLIQAVPLNGSITFALRYL